MLHLLQCLAIIPLALSLTKKLLLDFIAVKVNELSMLRPAELTLLIFSLKNFFTYQFLLTFYEQVHSNDNFGFNLITQASFKIKNVITS